MPEFRFEIETGAGERDDVNVELADVEQARRDAIEFAGELLKMECDTLRDTTMHVRVRDGAGSLVFLLSIAAATDAAASVPPSG